MQKKYKCYILKGTSQSFNWSIKKLICVSSLFKNIYLTNILALVIHTIIPELEKQRLVGFCEFKSCLVHRVSFRLVRMFFIWETLGVYLKVIYWMFLCQGWKPPIQILLSEPGKHLMLLRPTCGIWAWECFVFLSLLCSWDRQGLLVFLAHLL